MSDATARFLRAYDTWAVSGELCSGELFDAMLEARAELFDEQSRAVIHGLMAASAPIESPSAPTPPSRSTVPGPADNGVGGESPVEKARRALELMTPTTAARLNFGADIEEAAGLSVPLAQAVLDLTAAVDVQTEASALALAAAANQIDAVTAERDGLRAAHERQIQRIEEVKADLADALAANVDLQEASRVLSADVSISRAEVDYLRAEVERLKAAPVAGQWLGAWRDGRTGMALVRSYFGVDSDGFPFVEMVAVALRSTGLWAVACDGYHADNFPTEAEAKAAAERWAEERFGA